MIEPFFEHPILNSPYEYPARHWELDASGQPTQKVLEHRRRAEFITPIPKPRKRKKSKQAEILFQDEAGLSTKEQQYEITAQINEIRHQIEMWRDDSNPNNWLVTPETARLVQHWRYYEFNGFRPFFCQIEDDPKLYLFGQLKRITRQWFDNCLVCKEGTYPAQLMYQELADMACERITAAITRKLVSECPIKAILDPYNPVGSTNYVNFTTSKRDRWETIGPPPKCHVNWVILDSDWEAEFCRVAEAHPRVVAYVKNHNLGFEVPYQYGSEARKYRPDFIVLVDDGHPPHEDGFPDLLHLVVEIKGYRREDAKEKKSTMETYSVPGVNNFGSYGRWAFAEFCDVYEMQEDFQSKVEQEFNKLIDAVTGKSLAMEGNA